MLGRQELGDDPRHAFFADGLTMDLQTALVKISGLLLVGGPETIPLEQRDADKVEKLVREHALSLGKHIEEYAQYLD